MLPKTSPNYLQYKIHKRWLLSWIHFIVIIRATTFECFKMQMVVNLAPVSLSDKKVKFYTCPRMTFLQKNASENVYKSISESLYFKIFWGGGHAPRPPSSSRLWRSKLASSCSQAWLFWSLAVALVSLLAQCCWSVLVTRGYTLLIWPRLFKR